MKLLIFVLVLVILAELLLLALQCRRGHPELRLLRLYRYAHRGFHDKPRIPENSISAFRRAIDAGFGAELDVHLLRDGKLAVIHDSSLKRTAGADVRVEDLTAEELAQYRLEGTEERIPLFEEVLTLFSGKTPLIVELKSANGNSAALAEETCALLDRFPEVRYCIESFDPLCIRWLKKHRPEIVRGQLSTQMLKEDPGKEHSRLTYFLLSHLLLNWLSRPDFVAYQFSHRQCLAMRLCRRIYRVQEVSWTIRSRAELQSAEAAGAIPIFEKFDPRQEETS